jgi:cytochrome c oxidase cbb3-type subunit 3/ubiquinol-cytochrome c reductase cytochrome c subunit
MSSHSTLRPLFACALVLVFTACGTAPGVPKPGPEVPRPDQVLVFATLYSQNCAACHGAEGKLGAAISLANPVYVAAAGVANIQRVTAGGVPGTMMPPFATAAGGMLTPQQIDILAQGIVTAWGNAGELQGQTLPSYTNTATGDPAQGQKSFATFCSRCHRADSLTDPAYLSLISNQGLRSIIIAGERQQGMPDWRSCLTGAGARAMTEQEITDIVAWLASKRPPNPRQP